MKNLSYSFTFLPMPLKKDFYWWNSNGPHSQEGGRGGEGFQIINGMSPAVQNTYWQHREVD